MTTLSLFSQLEEEENEPTAPGERELTPRQREAVERREGSLFVHAGAGSGKTRVLVERFVRAVVDDGVDVDRVLAITFTEKAAAELRVRVRNRFLEAGEREQARAVDAAWISTIHGLCARLLRAHALDAGLDPEYRVLADHEAGRLAADAFDAGLEDFLGPTQDRRRVGLVAAYGPDRLAQAVRTVHAQMRGRGEREPALPRPPGPTATQLRHAHARLAEAVRAARDALAVEPEADPGTRVHAAVDRLDRCGGALGRLGPDGFLDPHELQDLAVRRGNVRVLRGEVFDALEQAHAACLELCARKHALDDLRLLDELLGAYGRRYGQLKTEGSALDFEDLELIVRDLLRSRPALRDQVRGRFEHVLVDELQDTNRLQSEILDLVAAGNLFTVGDDLQSIYGFRGADVSVFSERRVAARETDREVQLSDNFRTRAEILDVLNAAFEPVFGEGFAPLGPARPEAAQERGAAPRVELLAVDRDTTRWEIALAADEPFGAAMRGTPPWRAAEARLLARRIDELLRAGEFEPAEVAVLLRSWSDVSRYEQALGERGVPTYVAGGVGYWSTQQVADLRAYLATLANPRDEEALVSVLGSPLVGASLDALAVLGLRGRRGGGLWMALEKTFATEHAEGEGAADATALADALSTDDRDRLSHFVRHLHTERGEAPRRSLADLIERAICFTGYDRAVLRLPGGERRMANLRKLKRLAREFEAVEGRDLRGFLDAIESRGIVAAREGEAPLEGEGIDAVRLMTIHAAKGLEFPLVCVGDLGRGDPCDSPLLRVSGDGRIGLRLPDAERSALDALDARVLAEEAARSEREEERRLLWVAATRAEERLIVSGALDLECPPRGDGATAMEWLAPALVPDLREAHRAGEWEGTCARVWRGRERSVAWRALSPTNAGTLLAAEDRAPLESASSVETHRPSTPTTAGSSTGAPPRATAPQAEHPRPHEDVTRVSYSALESYRRCGYRFYLERRLRLPSEAERPGVPAAGPASLQALTRGAVAHELLERIDPRRPAPPPEEEIVARLRSYGAAATAGEVEELRRLLAGFLDSPLHARMASAQALRRELPFAFPLAADGAGAPARSILVEGTMDAHCREGTSALVVDYKTDRIPPGVDLEALCEDAYTTQRLVYALAALHGGADEVEVVHVFLERPQAPVLARHAASEREELEQQLRALIAGLVEQRFEPSPDPGADLCRGCPGRAALCWWPPERTGAGGGEQLGRTPADG